jgi:succinate dehydrogenase / fumarate reductase flavoprotein subunit
MYHEITNEDPYRAPMRIFPAPHYTMGGLWVDYNLMSNVPGLFVIGEANFSDHGANRLGASALMQGLADGYFVLPYTIGGYFASHGPGAPPADGAEFREAVAAASGKLDELLKVGGNRPASYFHRKLGRLVWDKCGMARNEQGLQEALQQIPEIRDEFWHSVQVPGSGGEFNQALEYAGRVADFLEFAELLCLDALERRESCGGHFREEYQTPDGEALRDDENFAHVAAWEYTGEGTPPQRHIEPLVFETVKPSVRSYK